MRNAECVVTGHGRTCTTMLGNFLPSDCGRFGVSNEKLGYTLWFKDAATRDELGRLKLWTIYCIRHGLTDQAGSPEKIDPDFEVTPVDR